MRFGLDGVVDEFKSEFVRCCCMKAFRGFKRAIKSIFGKGDSNFLSVFKPHRFSAEQVERVFWFD